MEVGNLNHMGAHLVSQLLMLYASSPEGRMLSESMMTDDPFKIDVHLNDTASNRNAEILNTYLKTIGLRIVFTKKLKQKFIPFMFSPFTFQPRPGAPGIPYSPFYFYDRNEVVTEDAERIIKEGKHHPLTFTPINFSRDMLTVKKKVNESQEEEE